VKYSETNLPLVCMQTQSACYKGTRTMTVRGVLWHSTGANNPNIKRYVQPSDDAADREAMLALLGVNRYHNDWNHTDRQAGMNCWIGKLADGTVATVQTMPWNYRPWGCGSGSKGSCNNGWIQFEICEDDLNDADYFAAVYREACEITAYLCRMFNIDPKGEVEYEVFKVPTILCHADSHKLGLGSNHGDVLHWFKKHGKTMDDVRADVEKLLGAERSTEQPAPAETTPAPVVPVAQEGDLAKTIWDFLLLKLGNAYGVAGVMGNLRAESALRPTNLQNTYEKSLGMTDAQYTAVVDSGAYSNFIRDSAGYGLAQWTYWSRKQALLEYARAQGKSIGDLGMQLGFLWKEMSENYAALVATLKAADSVKAASDAVLTKYERPADQGESARVKRAAYGQEYYDKFAAVTEIPARETGKSASPEKVIAVAVAEIGYKEKKSNSQLDDKTANAGSGNYTKYARDFDKKYPNWYSGKKNGFAWCDMFVDWCFLTAFGYEKALALLCQPEKSTGAGCKYSLRFFKKKGQFHTSDPKPGDQIFFGTSLDDVPHTGLVEKVTASKVYTIEGNSSDQVARRSYALSSSRILGYGRPAYDTVMVDGDKPTGDSAAPGGNVEGDASFRVKVSISNLNVRTGPGTDYSKTGKFSGKGTFTIVAVQAGTGSRAGWGKLSTGGWISLDYARKIE